MKNFSKKYILLSIAAVVLLMAYLLFFERTFVQTKEFYFESATKETDNIKVVQISDLHLQALNYPVRQVAKKVNELSPDLILFTGDAIDKAEHIGLVDDFLNLLDKRVQKAAIPGNWEYWSNVSLEELEHIYSQHTCAWLVNQTVQYIIQGKTISITGLDDFVGGNADIDASLKNYKKSDFHIVLNHCPEYTDAIDVRMAQDINIDLILSGHTHGGQINFFGFIPFLPGGSGNYVHGWYETKKSRLYVSKGIGTSVLPVRFGSRAEIAVFYLNSKK